MSNKRLLTPIELMKNAREDTIDEILQIIHNIYSHNLHCMADMCEREEKGYDCEDCMYTAIKNNLEKLKEKKDE